MSKVSQIRGVRFYVQWSFRVYETFMGVLKVSIRLMSSVGNLTREIDHSKPL